MGKIKLKVLSMYSLAVAFIIGLTSYNYASAAIPSATSTLDTLGGSIVNTGVDFATTVISTYWPYFLVFGILAAVLALFARFAHLGTKK
jgi:hypothetical protein